MHALDVLGDPVRRRILELLADDGGSSTSAHGTLANGTLAHGTTEQSTPELSAGEIGDVVQQEFGISQPAVSQHLRVLREHGFATVRAEGRRRLYAVDARGPREAKDWLSPFERFWLPKLDALGTELARGKRQRRLDAEPSASAPPSAPPSAAPSAVTAAAPLAVTATPSAASEGSPAPVATRTSSAPGTRSVAAPTPKET